MRHFIKHRIVAFKKSDHTLLATKTLYDLKKKLQNNNHGLYQWTFLLNFQVKNCHRFFYVLKGHLCHDGNNGSDAEKWLSAPLKRIE